MAEIIYTENLPKNIQQFRSIDFSLPAAVSDLRK